MPNPARPPVEKIRANASEVLHTAPARVMHNLCLWIEHLEAENARMKRKIAIERLGKDEPGAQV